MAGARQPVELVVVKGKKHLTKDEIESRSKSEVKAPNDQVFAPSYLSAAEKKKFIKISEELKKIDIISNLDCDCLARYIISETMYLAMWKKMKEKSVMNDVVLFEKTANLQDKFFKQCQATAKELGLTISSRCKLVVPKVEEKPENKFAKFGVKEKSG